MAEIAVERLSGVTSTHTWAQLMSDAYDFSCAVRNISHGGFIGLQMMKSYNYVVALCGCVMARVPFVPIAYDTPKARVAEIRKDANITRVITDDNFDGIADRYFYDASDEVAKEAFDVAFDFSEPTGHPVYAIYTSGSTGKPKGIVVSDTGIHSLVTEQTRAFEADTESRFLWVLENCFDGSLSDFFVAMHNRATLVLPWFDAFNPTMKGRYHEVMNMVEQGRVTHIDIPPSVLKCFSAESLPKSLKTIVIGGEAIDIPTARRYASKVNLVNVYGPTEATICTSLCRIDENWSKPLIGKPFEAVDYKVVNGELWIGGCQLAIGYINLPELNEQRFVTENGKRWYRTGDAVTMTEDGEYEFLGRIDRQFKYHGQLIAPEEVEAAYVSAANAAGFKINAYLKLVRGGNTMALFVENVAHDEKLTEDVMSALEVNTLTHYMIPQMFVIMDKFELTSTGKVDGSKLNVTAKLATVADESEMTPEELTVATAFKNAFDLETMPSLDTSFYDVGDSIGMIGLMCELEEKFKRGISPQTLLDNPTPRKLARALYEDSDKDTFVMTSDEIKNDIRSLGFTNGEADMPNGVLFTGANGFLGSRLVKKFLADPDYIGRSVYLLVRQQSIESCRAKLGVSENDSRVKFMAGDISKVHLGLNDADYTELMLNVSEVFHIAAEVNMIKTYAQLRDTNVVGTANVIALCKSGVQKKLHFASSLSVFVSTNRNTGFLQSDYELTKFTEVYGGYGQTKFAAELLVLNSGLDYMVYRYGLLTDDTETGEAPKNDFLGMFIRDAKRLGKLPLNTSHKDIENLAIDITPIDVAVAATLAVFKDGVPRFADEEEARKICHVSLNYKLHYKKILELLSAYDIAAPTVKYNEWFTNPDTNGACKQALCRINPNPCNMGMDLFQATNVDFDSVFNRMWSAKYEELIRLKKRVNDEYITKMILSALEQH